MQVLEAMTPDVVSVSPDTTLTEAAWIMKDFDVGLLPVQDGQLLLGAITDRDICMRAAEGRDPRTTQVRDVITPEVLCCLESDDVGRAAQLMRNARLRRLLVADAEGHLVGVVSLQDLVLRAGHDNRVEEADRASP
jgi:CBS domain-containing protein